MPPQDHISAKHKTQFTGVIKRIKDIYDDYRFSTQIQSNVYAPTAALQLFRHLAKVFPRHQLILADFDCFLTSMVKYPREFLGQN